MLRKWALCDVSCKYFSPICHLFFLFRFIVVIALLIFFFLIHEFVAMDLFFDGLWVFTSWGVIFTVKQGEPLHFHHPLWNEARNESLKTMQYDLKIRFYWPNIQARDQQEEKKWVVLYLLIILLRDILAPGSSAGRSGFDVQWKNPLPSPLLFLLIGQAWKRSCLWGW